jgi:hypothetical protein
MKPTDPEYYDKIAEVVKNCTPIDREDFYIPNRPIFDLAQALKGIDCNMLYNLSAEKMKDIVIEWFEYHGANMPDGKGENLSTDEIWAIFIDVWDRIKFPKGPALQKAVKKAEQTYKKLPQAKRYRDKKIQHLVGVCYELQQLHGDEPFWLSCYDAGWIMGKSHTRANQIMKMLVFDKVLKVDEKHTAYKAVRYRFIEDNRRV